MAADFGLGLAALGRPGYITAGRASDLPRRDVAGMAAQADAVLDAAHAGGIRRFDAARGYGLAERFLGRWLARRHVRPGTVHVASKWGYAYAADWRVEAPRHEVKDLTLRQFTRQWDESRAELGPWLGLYQVHSLTRDSGAFDDARLLDALARVRDSGMMVGFSTSGPGQGETIDAALRLAPGGRPLFGAVQATWNLWERAAAPALARAAAAGLRVIVKEALANGRLTDRALAGPQSDAPGAGALRILAARAGVGIDALALSAAAIQPWAGTVLLGAATPVQVAANLRAKALSPDIAEEAASCVPPADPAAYWADRAALAWG